MRRLALAVPALMGLVCGTYSILYLVRWEWNRAIIAGLFFVAVEVVVVATLVLDRLRRIEGRLDALAASSTVAAPPPAGADATTLEAIRAAASPPPDRFAWLRDQAGGTNVFLPVLLGAGVLASALAWAVERLARATLTPVRERRLAEGLGALRPPPRLVGGPWTPEPPPRRSPVRRAGAAAAALGVVAGTAAGTVAAVDFVADRTQSRPDTHVAGAATTLELELHGAIADRNPERVLGHLWATCTGPDVFRLRTLPAPEVHRDASGHLHVRVDAHVGDNAMERLRGCLNDTTLDRVQARVVRTSVVLPG